MTKRFKISIIFLGSLIVATLAAYGQLSAGDDYLSVTGPCNQTFPQDHGSHPGYRTEWWYYTGNLTADSGDRYGYQLTFFRSQIGPPGANQGWPRPSSAWRTQQFFVGHAALTDLNQKRHLQAETVARGALDLAGVVQKNAATTVFVKNWSARIDADSHTLEANTADFAINLNLETAKPPVLHGDTGYSRKGSTAERASCYYSLTRLNTSGSLKIGAKTVAVEGLSWMDHEYSTTALEAGIVGWDWFSLQLSDQTELMLYLLRAESGETNPASSGTFVDRSGVSRHLTAENFSVSVLEQWKSPRSGAVYPSAWRVHILPLDLVLTVSANLADQEMMTVASTGVIYWEGSVSATGVVDNQRVIAEGYVELTGYAGPFRAPL